jgi:hypothetical protein
MNSIDQALMNAALWLKRKGIVPNGVYIAAAIAASFLSFVGAHLPGTISRVTIAAWFGGIFILVPYSRWFLLTVGSILRKDGYPVVMAAPGRNLRLAFLALSLAALAHLSVVAVSGSASDVVMSLMTLVFSISSWLVAYFDNGQPRTVASA